MPSSTETTNWKIGEGGGSASGRKKTSSSAAKAARSRRKAKKTPARRAGKGARQENARRSDQANPKAESAPGKGRTKEEATGEERKHNAQEKNEKWQQA